MNLRVKASSRRAALAMLMLLTAVGGTAHADFRQTTDNATVAFEGPSAKATRLYVYSRGSPLEVVVQIEGWVKVRDAQGALVWLERKALGERTNVQVKATTADVFTAPDATSAIVYRAEPGVLLQLVTPQPPNAGAWAQVRHRDGQVGFVRLDAVFGL